MLLSQSGSDLPRHSQVFRMDDTTQVGEARRFASLLCEQLGFQEVRRARVGIIINELGNNLVKYAKNGQLILRGFERGADRGIEILSIDQGPGLENSAVAMADGFSTGSTPGTGLGAVRRQSDVFDLYSVKEKGTAIVSITMAQDALPDTPKAAYEMSVINAPVRGESVCGDDWSFVLEKEGLHVLVVDGLGHGPQAHKAAREAVFEFEKSFKEPQERLIQLIHGRLKSTRGAAVFVVTSKEGSQVESSGVGNIRAFLQGSQKSKHLISQNGTAGLQMRSVKPLQTAWEDSTYLILHSDGITARWDLSQYPGLLGHHPAIVAAVAYRDFTRGNDDATLLVVRKRK